MWNDTKIIHWLFRMENQKYFRRCQYEIIDNRRNRKYFADIGIAGEGVH